MTDDTISKTGRGGRRPGAGRPKTNWKNYTISLPAETGERVKAAAEADGITVYAWIVQAVKERLERKGSPAP